MMSAREVKRDDSKVGRGRREDVGRCGYVGLTRGKGDLYGNTNTNTGGGLVFIVTKGKRM